MRLIIPIALTLALALAAPAMADTRPAPVPAGPTALADIPREPVPSCQEYAEEVYDKWGWWAAAFEYLECITSPHHPSNDGRPSVPAPNPASLSDVPRDMVLSCQEFAEEVYDKWGWFAAAFEYLECITSPHHPSNTP